jgi:hypothetical protein
VEPVYLRQTNFNQLQLNTLEDTISPFSYLEWKAKFVNLNENDTVYLYNKYLIEWFQKNKNKPVDAKFQLRQKYIRLLDQLELFFTSEEKNNWYRHVNLADEKELLVAIPYFARRLKDIALYYLNLRKKLQNVKLKYNAVGTSANLELEIYNYLLNAFSTESTELESHIYTTVPLFSSLQKHLRVHVEEKYDDHQYFDVSLSMPVSAYYDLLDKPTEKFLLTKGITLSSSHWLFESFNIPVSSNFDSVFSNLTGNLFELTNSETFESYIQKYLGQTKSLLSIAQQVTSAEVFNINIIEGNNFFYYPYGVVDTTYQNVKQIPIISLSAISFTDFSGEDGSPTAGTTLENSDVIFVKAGNVTKGAWLKYQEYEEVPKTVKAAIKKDSKTSFIFPFPGYGLSGNNYEWTGSNFESTAEYSFLTRELKSAVNEAYWSQILPTDTCNSILLNNTTLASNGAYASQHPQHADQVYIKPQRDTDTSQPSTQVNGAWLYKFQQTTLPVSPIQDNVILWPYCIIDVEEDYPSHLNNLNFVDACVAVNVQNLPTTKFIAASSFELADKIYKINNYTDVEEQATECAWLSGVLVENNEYAYITQGGFNSLFPPGESVKFVWTGPTTSISEVFSQTQHRRDCLFVTNSSVVSSLQWNECQCKQVYHSPFGHPHNLFEQGNNHADCIAEVTDPLAEELDFSSWKDLSGNNISNSPRFAWFKTKNYKTWGNGEWVNNIKRPLFNLETGKAYFYKRASNKIGDEEFPPYTVSYSFPTSPVKWIAAKINPEDGTWSESPNNFISTMTLYPGDYIKISRQSSTTSYVVSSYEIQSVLSNNVGSVWSAFDVIPKVCGEENGTTISWPSITDPQQLKNPQYPHVSVEQINSYIGWTITREEDGFSDTIYNVSFVTFIPPTTGTYSVSVTATVLNPSNGVKFPPVDTSNSLATLSTVVIDSIIPKISALNPFTIEKAYTEFTTPSNGFVLEHSLKGWNYNISKQDKRANGARPYWAILDVEKDPTTRWKGLYSWGYPDTYIDDYIPYNQPLISPLELSYGSVVEYTRKGYSFSWQQPITYKEYVNTTQWCQISADVTRSSNLSSIYLTKLKIDPIVLATNIPSDIRLSNIIEGEPVEVYYYALDNFVWPITTINTQVIEAPSATPFYVSDSPWETLQNRFYPTIANVPVQQDTYTLEDVGGYFLPQNLGATMFVNKEFDPILNYEELSGTALVEDVSVHIGGRGRTKQDQATLYDWKENNQWLKETITTGDLAGAIKHDLTKVMQTFIPYQSDADDSSLGLITTETRLSPWGGYRDEQWIDYKNDPKSFTGVRNISAWAKAQVIQQVDKPIDNWTTDIYGNQYGLFKNLDNVSVYDRRKTPGEIWVRSNDQTLSPGYIGLSSVFEPFKFNNTVFSELTGSGILNIECYFDTLFIETPTILIYAKIDYNYTTGQIDGIFDDTRYRFKKEKPEEEFERNWFLTTEKKILSLYTLISAQGPSTSQYFKTKKYKFSPVVYELDLVQRKNTKIYPITLTEIHSLTSSIIELDTGIKRDCSLYYNNSQNEFLVTYTGYDSKNSIYFLDFTIKNIYPLSLARVDYYTNLYDEVAFREPPIVLSPYLTAINVNTNSFSVFVSAINIPASCSLLNYTTAVSAITSNEGITFEGQLTAGLHHINYVLNNSIGEVTYCLTLSAL